MKSYLMGFSCDINGTNVISCATTSAYILFFLPIHIRNIVKCCMFIYIYIHHTIHVTLYIVF